MTSSVVAFVSVLSFFSGVVLAYEGSTTLGRPVPVAVARALGPRASLPPRAGAELAPPNVMELPNVLIVGDLIAKHAGPKTPPAASARP